MINKIFGSVFNNLISNAEGIIDECVTTKEEKIKLKNEIQKALLDAESKAQEQVSKRWAADMNSDSWLSKNIRPMTLIFLTASTVLIIFMDAGAIQFEVKSSWIDLLQLTLITVIGAYFGGRSLEKVKNTNNNKNNNKNG
jgi:cation transport ATPase|tara:strand:+ start:436 stop:855 length:420 start_codon:yes stop_codon:yes gene_type:complete